VGPEYQPAADRRPLKNPLLNVGKCNCRQRGGVIVAGGSKKIPDDFKALHPDIEWKKMSGMRDRLIHDYFGVDYFIVFDVAQNKAPSLVKQVELALTPERTLGDELEI